MQVQSAVIFVFLAFSSVSAQSNGWQDWSNWGQNVAKGWVDWAQDVANKWTNGQWTPPSGTWVPPPRTEWTPPAVPAGEWRPPTVDWTGGGGNWAGSGVSVTTRCDQNGCQTCVNNRCYGRGNFQRVIGYGNCPATACEMGCGEAVFYTDDCPICRCNGFSTREICSSNSDCKLANGNCTSNLCRYPPVPDNLPKMCTFAHECPEIDNCVRQKCQRDPGNRRHVMHTSCVFNNQCPTKHTCQGMTCWEGGQEHTNSECVFDYQCPNKYSCQQMTCVQTGKEHGRSMCYSSTQCPSGQSCLGMTCQ